MARARWEIILSCKITPRIDRSTKMQKKMFKVKDKSAVEKKVKIYKKKVLGIMITNTVRLTQKSRIFYGTV